ncbi:MAG: hypothetical protein KJ971_02405 [Firmicutes bacterium]|nr:hypothetical protein [Bacillota bacterium]
MQIPENLDFVLYFNIAFFSMLGLGMFFGFLRGFKKSLYSFITTLIFYVFFFLTINIVINFLWTLSMPWLGGAVGGFLPALADVTSLKDALPILLQNFLPEQFTQVLENDEFLAFTTGVSLFVIKIVYTILYFTVIQVIYKLLFFFIRIIFFGSSKKEDKYRSKNRGFGALFGLLSGAISVFVMLIIVGGLISMGESLVSLLPSTDDTQTVSIDFPRQNIYEASYSVIPLASPIEIPEEFTAAIDMMNSMVEAFNTNIVVSTTSQFTIIDEATGIDLPLNLYLFDSVLSFTYRDEKISVRNELAVVSQIAGIAINSAYMDTKNVSDISGDDVSLVFDTLSYSDLFTSIMPLAIEVAADYFDTEITIPTEELYAIDWQLELEQLGDIAAIVFDLVNSAGIFNDEMDLETVTIDGDTVRDLFDSLGNSELITLGAYVAVEPVLLQATEQIQAIITVPTDLVWEDEFVAIGAVIGAILDTDITVGQIQSGDAMLIIGALAQLDFTVLLDSKIITNALKNVLSGAAGIEGLDMLVIPDDIIWFDELDDDGNVILNGELRNILLAVNSIASQTEDIDINNIDIYMIADLDVEAINSLFESKILVATLSSYILEQDFGDLVLVIPDSVFDENDYLLKEELQALASSIKLVFTDLACEVEDTTCAETGFDLSKALSLSEASIDTLLASDIVAATVGDLVIDMGADNLTIPSSALIEIFVGGIGQDVISKPEIKNAFLAISVLGITDINNLEVDASILSNLGTELDPTILDNDKTDKLFASSILHATLSTILLDLTTEDESVILVPYKNIDEEDIRYTNVTDSIEYISTEELTALIGAILVLDITDFANFDTLNLNLVIDNSDTLLESAILHATISKQLFDMVSDGFVTVPYIDEHENPIRVTVGDAGFETEYIEKEELTNAFDALGVLGITDITLFDGNIDLSVVAQDDNASILLSSSIIQATVSKTILDLEVDDTLDVPYVADDDITEIRVTVGSFGFETEYIVSSEIEAIIKALDVLEITDMESFTGTIDLSVLADDTNSQTVLASSVIQATISAQIIDLDTNLTLNAPYVSEDDITPIRITVGPLGYETEYITKIELDAIFEALNILGITDVESFTGTVDLGVLAEGDNASIVLESSVIQATISKTILDLDLDGTLDVPYFAQDDSTLIRITVGALLEEFEYISAQELESVILALDVLEITNVELFTGSVDLSLLADDTNSQIVLSSSIIQATISTQIIDLDVAGTLDAPYLADDDITAIRVTVGTLGFETEYIIKTELDSIFDALNVLGITDVESFTGSVDLSLLAEGNNAAIVLASSVIQATVSTQVLELDVAGTIEVPYVADDDLTLIRVSVGLGLTATEYVVKTELEAMIFGLDILEITDVESFDGSIDLTSFYDETNRNILLSSSTMQATISKQLLDLGSASLTVPYVDASSVVIRLTVGTLGFETEYVTKLEIGAIFEALEILEITDVTTFSGDIDLTSFYIEDTRTVLLTSASMHATVSKQLLDLGSDVLNIPYTASDDSTEIRTTVGPFSFETEFVVKDEIHAIFEALELLNITDIDSFTGSIDLTSFYIEENRTILLTSASMHATISKQLFDLGDEVLTVPFEDFDEAAIRVTVGELTFETEYITKAEISAMFEALEVLQITDINTFSGTVNLTRVYGDTNQNIILASASMHATITKQLDDLGSEVLVIPDTDVDSISINKLVLGLHFIYKTELKAIINALEILGITDINSFDGSVSLVNLFDDTNQTILLSSASMHATITQQLDDLGPLVLTIPLTDVDNVSIQTIILGYHFIYKTEIKAIINSLEILGITNITSFDGTVSLLNLFDDTNQNTLLSSASMHATITQQLTDLGSEILLIPTHDVDSVLIQAVVSSTLFIYKSEIKAIINALEVLGITNITSFNGTVSLTNLYSEANQITLLTSASMHATITQQIDGLGSSVLLVPERDIDSNLIQGDVFTTHFIYKFEIKALINALEVLGITDITAFSGTFDLSKVALEADQITLLSSASMHATISKTLFELGSDVLIVPTFSQLGEIEANRIQVLVSLTNFIIKGEIKALINAFTAMGYTDLNSFGVSIDSSEFFNDPDTLLLSSSIQATLSDKLINDTDGNLIVPNTNYLTTLTIRIVQADVTYVELNEMKAILNALELLGLTDFSNIDINPANVFSADFDELLTSYSMQATISKTLLDGAVLDGSGTGELIVPNFFRETINVGLGTNVQIEKEELKALLTSLETLGVLDFDGAMDPTVVTSMTDEDLTTLLLSGSMQVTIDDMLKDNPNIVVPDLATEDVFNLTSITTKVEIKAFIIATQLMGATDISTVSFNYMVIAALTPEQRDVVLDSMIVRNLLTDQLEATMLADDPFDLYWPLDSEYEDPLDPSGTFLTEVGINNVLTHYGFI